MQKNMIFLYLSVLKNKIFAGIAQLAEQLICNQQVVGSSPITSSKSEWNNIHSDFLYPKSRINQKF